MQDARALNNSRNLNAWRAWEAEAYRRSGFILILMAVPSLATGFVVAVTLFGRGPGRVALPALATGMGGYLAVVIGLMAWAMLRLNAWKRAHPWTPPTRSP